MEQADLFRRLAVALAIGLLIGLERGWQMREEAEGERTAGLRTYALAALLGGICGAASKIASPLLLPAAFLAFAAAFTLFSWFEATSERNFSVTGVVAGLLTFALGAFAVIGDLVVSVAAAVAMAILLALKAPLHSWLRRLSWLEVRAALILLAMSFVLLPLLPDRPVGPWTALNPAEIWFLAILIAGVSFAGYIAVRAIGEEAGIVVAAIAGGVTSSTATTLSFARLGREHPEASSLLAGGILIAGVTMMARIVVIVAAIAPRLVPDLALPLAAAGAVLAAASALLIFGHRMSDLPRPRLELRNPFDLWTALKLAALIAVILVLSEMLSESFGGRGILLLAAASGIADVDALTLSMSRLAGSRILVSDAVAAILFACCVNTIFKTAMAIYVGGWAIGRTVAIASALAVAVLALVHAYVPPLNVLAGGHLLNPSAALAS
jgi:uncharacterized membrane protein (DUF4010 family)